MQVEGPFTHSEIVLALTEVEHDVADFFSSLSQEEFVLRVGEAWTPAEHLQHLNLSVRAIARGLSVPRWLLPLLFGRAKSHSRGFMEMRERYRGQLSGGARASAAFTPPPEQLDGGRILERRAEILARWARVNAAVQTALGRWSERDLDRITLPHPILKKITAREMLFFMIYHDEHHIAAAKARLPRFSQSTGG
jgi:hypothetical protein